MEEERPLRGLAAIDSGMKQMSDKEMISFYNEWSLDYDKDHSDNYFAARHTAFKLVERLTASGNEQGINKDVHIMDLGGGTGLIAELLKGNGYHNIDVIDISPKMLEIARRKDVYKKLICGSFTTKVSSVEESTYDAVVAAGVFTLGHAQASGFDEAVRITKPGGLIIFTVRGDAYEYKDSGYADKIDELCKTKAWQILECLDVNYNVRLEDNKNRALLYVCMKTKDESLSNGIC